MEDLDDRHNNDRIIEEVKKYENLYNSNSEHYKDSITVNNSWQKISLATGMEVTECMKRWKNLRDKYVRLCKKRTSIGGDVVNQKLPPYYRALTWLDQHVKHRGIKSRNRQTTSSSSAESYTASGPPTTKIKLATLAPRPPPPDCSSPEPGPPESPTSGPAEAPAPKRRREPDDWCVTQMTNLEERRVDVLQKLQLKLLQGTDECSRFGQTMADMLRRVPEERRPDVMFQVYSLIHENRQ
ncbi:uncharacterized protein LOC114477422 [Gouania willdenowi]|uniref:uncharacterized protein LOC114477422 n=1 Tax=Gouania willdenowi TaxID=441366 RepID=UPI0010554EC1|nr:uncharacterized protein LOC114477422 [Gouania willdenowi]